MKHEIVRTGQHKLESSVFMNLDVNCKQRFLYYLPAVTESQHPDMVFASSVSPFMLKHTSWEKPHLPSSGLISIISEQKNPTLGHRVKHANAVSYPSLKLKMV